VDIAAMRANFAKAAATGDEAPLYFYSHLFLSHPETRALFPLSMARQRDRLFQALGDVVHYVDDLDSLVPILQALGRDHRKFGTVAEHYPAVGASLLATLKHFDDDWNEALEQDWTAAYQLVAQVMIEAAESASDKPAWWDADIVSHERRGSTSPSCGSSRARPTASSRASRSRSRRTCAPSCGATTRRPTLRAPTASWSCTSRPATAARSVPRSSARPTSATCCAWGRRWATSAWTPAPTATCCSSPAAWAWRR